MEILKMNKIWKVAAVPGILAFMAGALILVLFLVKIIWSWTIPDLFPGAVEQGLIAESISWYTALKLSVFIAILTAIASKHPNKHTQYHNKTEPIKKQE